MPTAYDPSQGRPEDVTLQDVAAAEAPHSIDYSQLAVVDPDGPGAAPDEAYVVKPDGEHDYEGDDAPTPEELRSLPAPPA